MSTAARARRPLAYLAAIGIVVLGSTGFFLFDRASTRTPPESYPSPVAQGSPTSPEHVDAVPPALKATVPDGISSDLLERTRSVPGVFAAARVLLSNLTVEMPGGGGGAQVSVAAIDPDEFRPLAPEASAQAGFVWDALKRSETFLAHEQFQILGGKPLKSLTAEGPYGRKDIRIAGLAASGVPNLAGAMMSLSKAGDLGLGNPTMLMVAFNRDADHTRVLADLRTSLPGIAFEETRPFQTRTFFSGTAAQKAIGSFAYSGNPDGTIRQDGEWVAQNIVDREVPLLGRVRCHKAIFPQLEAALTEIEKAGLAATVKPGQYGGCYVPRFIDRNGSLPLSMHAWGLALDINVADNPKGAKPDQDMKMVEIMEKWGFRWGGRWSPPDAHHFELAALVKQS